MLPTIQKSEIFQKELKVFEETTDKLKNEDLKTKAKNLINQLISEVKKVDRFHSDPTAFKDVTGLQGSRDNIASIRKKLHKICKDYNESIK